MTRDEWLETFAQLVGVAPPTPDDVEALLELAGVAAHGSERTAAPLTCWLAAQAGLTPTEALRVAERLAQRPAGDTATAQEKEPS